MDYPTDSSTFSPTQVHGHEDYEHIFNHDHDQHQLVRDLDRRDELKGETGEDVDEGEGRISAYPQEPPDHEVRTLDENNKNRYGHHEGLEAHGEIHRHELHHELGQEQGEDETGNRHNYGYYYGQEAEHGDDYEQEYGQQQREVEQDDEVQQRGQPSESDDVLDVTQLTSPVPESLSASTSTPTSSALSHPALTTASTSAPAPAPQQAPEIEIAPGSTSLPAEASSPLFPARISASAIDGAEEMSIPPNLRLGRHAQGHMKTPGAGYTQIPSDTETHVHPLHFSAQAVQTTLETGQALETDSHVLAAQITADVAEEQAAAEEETETAVQARQILLEAANLSLPNDMDALREEVRRLREQLRISQQHQHEHGFGNVDGNEHEHPGDKDHVQHEENELQEQQEQQEQQERLEEIAEIAEDKLGGNQGLMQVEHIVEGSQVGVDQDAIALDRFDFGQAVSGAEEQSEEHGEVDGEEVEMEEENEEDAVAAAAAAASMDDYIAQHLAALGQAQEDPPHPHVEDHSINQHEQPDPDYENQHDLTQSLHDHQIQHEHDHHGHTDLNDQHQHQHIHTDHPDERYHSDFLDSTGLVGVGDYPAVGFDHLAAAASEYDQLVVNHQQFSQSHEDQALGTADGLQSAHHNQSPYGQNESGKPDQRMKKSKKKKLDSASVSEHARRQIDSGVASRGESTLLNAPMATSSEDHKKKRTTGKRKRGVTGVVPAHSDSHILVDPQLLYEYDPRQAEHATHEMYSHEAYQHHQQHHEQLMLQQSQERENKVIVPISEETGKRVSQRDRMDQLSKAVRQRVSHFPSASVDLPGMGHLKSTVQLKSTAQTENRNLPPFIPYFCPSFNEQMRQELHIGEEDPLPGPEQGGPHWMLGPRHPNNIEWHEHIAEVVLDGLLRGEMHFNVPDSQLNIESAKVSKQRPFFLSGLTGSEVQKTIC